MTASFRLALDTVTHVAAAINGGKGFTEKPTVTLELALDPDAALVKIWGDINPLDPMNAGMATTEAGAEWLEATADWLIALTTNPGLKELHVRVQDDVGNEATANASITLSGEGPPVPPIEPEPTHPQALPASGGPEVVPEPERRHLVSIGSVGKIASSSFIAASRVMAPVGIGAPVYSSNTVRIRAASSLSEITTHVETSVTARSAAPGSSLGAIPSSASIVRRDGEAFIAALIDLGVL
jgi:hypothetical protein